jgi:hypothetical protein
MVTERNDMPLLPERNSPLQPCRPAPPAVLRTWRFVAWLRGTGSASTNNGASARAAGGWFEVYRIDADGYALTGQLPGCRHRASISRRCRHRHQGAIYRIRMVSTLLAKTPFSGKAHCRWWGEICGHRQHRQKNGSASPVSSVEGHLDASLHFRGGSFRGLLDGEYPPGNCSGNLEAA